MIHKSRVVLGDEVKCSLTGYKGTIDAVAFHLNGCIRVSVTGKMKKDGTIDDGYWFDEIQLKVTKAKKKTKLPASTGGFISRHK